MNDNKMKCEKCQHVHEQEDGTCKCGCTEGKKEEGEKQENNKNI